VTTATAISIPAPRRELAFRRSGGLEITLYWDADERTTSVEVHQPATRETIVLTVPDEDALDAFHHPFAHLERANARRLTTFLARPPTSSFARR
jgi:hypothetical protein